VYRLACYTVYRQYTDSVQTGMPHSIQTVYRLACHTVYGQCTDWHATRYTDSLQTGMLHSIQTVYRLACYTVYRQCTDGMPHSIQTVYRLAWYTAYRHADLIHHAEKVLSTDCPIMCCFTQDNPSYVARKPRD